MTRTRAVEVSERITQTLTGGLTEREIREGRLIVARMRDVLASPAGGQIRKQVAQGIVDASKAFSDVGARSVLEKVIKLPGLSKAEFGAILLAVPHVIPANSGTLSGEFVRKEALRSLARRPDLTKEQANAIADSSWTVQSDPACAYEVLMAVSRKAEVQALLRNAASILLIDVPNPWGGAAEGALLRQRFLAAVASRPDLTAAQKSELKRVLGSARRQPINEQTELPAKRPSIFEALGIGRIH